jgi:hypothetical protein
MNDVVEHHEGGLIVGAVPAATFRLPELGV